MSYAFMYTLKPLFHHVLMLHNHIKAHIDILLNSSIESHKGLLKIISIANKFSVKNFVV